MALSDNIKKAFKDSGVLGQIIIINAVIFLIANISKAVVVISNSGSDHVFNLLAVPAKASALLYKPWTLFTYMFFHQDFFHFLFNMLWLFWMGRIILEFVRPRLIVITYLVGGLCGALLYILLYALIPSLPDNTYLLGASAGVMAVVVSAAVLVPNYIVNLLFIGPVKIKYVALVSFVLTSVLDLSQNTGGKIAHIGGAVYGLLFMLQYKQGRDWTKVTENIFKPFTASGRSMKVVHKKKLSDDEFNLNKAAKQKKVDEILDKISKSGYDSLTKDEKDFLFNASKN